MSAAPPPDPALVVRPDEPLAPRTTLRIGGRARWLVEARSLSALVALLRWADRERVPVLPLGKGSNVLVDDDGYPGVVLLLGGDFLDVSIDPPRVVCGGGVSLMALALRTRDAGLSGLEALSGIPSSFGGAVRINAGSYGSELFDVLESVTLVSRRGDARTVPAASLAHGYRHTELVERDDLVVSGSLVLTPAPREVVEARLAEVAEKRRNALPRQPNAGSVFKNPPGRFAGQLLEACGLKGRRVGGAEVSRRHANVIVNGAGATARDVRALMEEMRAAVAQRFGIELEPEVEIVGGEGLQSGRRPAP